MKKEKIKKAGEGIKKRIIKRQNIIYFTLIGIGASFATVTISGTKNMTGEAIAFIITGSIGIIMSWTTTDIGESIKDVMREVGRDNQKALESLAKSQDNIAKSQDNIAKSQDNIAKSQDNIAKSQDNIAKSLVIIAKTQGIIIQSQGTIVESLDEIEEILNDGFSKTQQEISKVHDDTTKLLQK